MSSKGVVVGIDLGTTNSAVAYLQDGAPRVLPVDAEMLLPSVVGFSPDGDLLVGRAARNQRVLYPERTVRSIKRRMGEEQSVAVGEETLTPVEISSLILRRLKSAAEEALGRPVTGAVITVPAYFSDAQRQATRQAGELAGLKVERIINEPTAASLCYVNPDDAERTLLVYDLGGGTFDVSVVRTRGPVTEVLASHGDNQLGGDDMDALLMAELRERFEAEHDVTLDGAPDLEKKRALARLERASEEAKIALSTEAYVSVREEHLLERDGVALHLDQEISRDDYERLIAPLLERTRDSVQIALGEAKITPAQIDEVILVGGATHTPLVQAMLIEITDKMPHADVDPERAVALGAAVQAGLVTGEETGRVLVDVTPFSFGTSFFGMLRGEMSPHCYKVVVGRNTPLPARRSEIFYTLHDGQEKVAVEVFQGEAKDARDNILIGNFMIEDLDPAAPEGSPVVFEMKLGLDGILEVKVTERRTGNEKRVTIENAFRTFDPEEAAAARRRMAELYGEDEPSRDEEQGGDGERDGGEGSAGMDVPAEPPQDWDEAGRAVWARAAAGLQKAGVLMPSLVDLDREEVAQIAEQVRRTMEAGERDALDEAVDELEDVLFYLE
jgi:molecular chaperone DnaK (HSP70)